MTILNPTLPFGPQGCLLAICTIEGCMKLNPAPFYELQTTFWVLWHTVKAIQKESSDLDCLIYTDDHDASSNSLMARVVQHFGGIFKVRVEKQV
ncbi:hypothetical protein AAG906_012797 [Vitis piasezkii]